MIDYQTKTKGNAEHWVELLNLFAERYWRWYTTHSRGRAHDVEYKTWWISRGPINFKTTEQSRMFYSELFQHVLTTYVNPTQESV